MEKYNLDRLPFHNNAEFKILNLKDKLYDLPEWKYSVNFALPDKTPILAAKDGVVHNIKKNSISHYYPDSFGYISIFTLKKLADKYSNRICINHGDWFYSEYMNLSKKVEVEKGDKVKVGDLLGYTGLTGIFLTDASLNHSRYLQFNVSETSTGEPVSIPVEFSSAKDLELYPSKHLTKQIEKVYEIN